jgi:LPXTG-site transpeptidase (sortase) family protein
VTASSRRAADSRTGGRRRVALLVAALVLLVAAVGTAFALTRDDEPTSAAPGPTSTPTPTATASTVPPMPWKPIGEPERLAISAIDVDAPVLPVGTTPEGAQEVPSSLAATGWWRDGQKPGQDGNAVIVGHTASKGDGVFDELGELEKGDEITVSAGKRSLTYTVTKEQVVEVADFATVADEIYREDGTSGLVLMTCGDWNGTAFETTVIVHATRAA